MTRTLAGLRLIMSSAGESLYANPDGRVWCGATEEWGGFDHQVSEPARRSILKRAVNLIPEPTQAPVLMHTACLRPVTPDWLPIISRVPGYTNAYIALGAANKGILMCPGMGTFTAGLVTVGGTHGALREMLRSYGISGVCL